MTVTWLLYIVTNKLSINKRRIGIVKKYPNMVKIVELCDAIIFEIPSLTAAINIIIQYVTLPEKSATYALSSISRNASFKLCI